MAKRKKKRIRYSQLRPSSRTPLGDNVRARRSELGVSRWDLARKSGVSHAAIRTIEEGSIQDPRLSSVVKLAKALEISIDVLAGVVSPIPLE